MKITDQENLNIHLTMADKLKDSKPRTLCPSCHADSWQLEKQVFYLSEFMADSPEKTACVPVLARLCTGCGYIMFYNAMFLGIKFTQAPAPVDQIKLDDGSLQEVQ